MAIEGIKLRDKKILILNNNNWLETFSKDSETDFNQLKKYIQSLKPKLISLCTGMPDTLQGLRRNKVESEEKHISESEVSISEVQTEAGTVLRVKTVQPQPTNFLDLYDEQEAFIAKPDPPKKMKVVKANSEVFEQKLKSLSIKEESKPNFFLKIFSENKKNISKTDTIVFLNKRRKIIFPLKNKKAKLNLLTLKENTSKKDLMNDKMNVLNLKKIESVVKFGKRMKSVRIKLNNQPAKQTKKKREVIEDEVDIFSKFSMKDDFDQADTLFFPD